MVVLGLLLVVIALLAVIIVVLEGGDPAQIDLQWFTTRTDMRGIFAAGALTVLLAVLGLSLLINGLKRSRRKRAEVKELEQRAARREPAVRESPPVADTSPGNASTPRTESTTRGPSTDSHRPARAETTDGNSQGASSSTVGGSSTAAGSTTPVVRRRPDDGHPDEHFESTPRDQ
jgi:hypothetical protein